MPPTDHPRRRSALFVLFFIPGAALASWVTRTPAIRDGISASLSEMGLVLLGLSLGSICGLVCAAKMVSLWGTRTVAILGTALLLTGLVGVSGGVLAASAPLVALGLGLFGLGTGIGEIAINVDGADEERRSARPLMHLLHGCFSLGTVCGALIGFACTWLGIAVAAHLTGIAVASATALLLVMRHLPKGVGQAAPQVEDKAAAPPRDAYWRDRRLYLIGIIVLAMALAEGAANDWLPILMVDEHGFSPASGSLVYVGFAIAMTVGRFGGGHLLERLGPATVIRWSAVLCAAGLAVVILSPVPQIAAFSVVLWGLGASLGFPIAISAAGASGPNATGRVQAITLCGYSAFLVGPPLLGFIGEHFGLRSAMLVVLLLILITVMIARAVQPQHQDPT